MFSVLHKNPAVTNTYNKCLFTFDSSTFIKPDDNSNNINCRPLTFKHLFFVKDVMLICESYSASHRYRAIEFSVNPIVHHTDTELLSSA